MGKRLGRKTRQRGVVTCGPVNPTMEGGLPVTWPSNWWQRNLQPFGGGATAILQACIDAYAQTIASLRAAHRKHGKNGGSDFVKTSALARVLHRPNAYQTRSDFMLNLVWSLLSHGNGYAWAQRDEVGTIIALHLFDPRNAAPYIDPETGSVFYSLGGNPFVAAGIAYMIPARDVLHVRLHTPRHPLVGVTPAVAAALALAANSAITGHQAAFFGNMARPSGVLSTEQSLTKVQIETLRAAWEAQSAGMNSGGVPILANGLKWQGLSINSQDSQVVQAFNMTVEDVARAFRVPLPLVGAYQHATYNNVEQLISLWMATGLGFVLEHIELAFDALFELPVGDFTEFDTETLLRTDFKGRIEALTKGIAGGLYSPNEARGKEGLPSVEYGDEPRVQAQVVPLSQVGATPAPSAPTAEPAPLEDESADDDEAKSVALAMDAIKRAMA
jgi:HK97 family phage portal protein